MTGCTIRRFDRPDELRNFERGTFEVVRLGDLVLGRASYEPGWRWSTHVAPIAGTASCQVAHLGLVLAGRCMVKMDDGTEIELKPGDLFDVAPGHDSWVVGDTPYVSLHFMGADEFAK